MRNFLLLSAILIQNAWAIGSESNVQLAINAFSKHKDLQSASISFLAVDLSSNQVLGTYDAQRLLAPASTVKLWSTAGALELLGANFRPKTELYYSGNISRDTLFGSIMILGFGDASLGSMHFGSRENMRGFLNSWADSLIAKGIKVIQGHLFTDASKFGYFGPPDGWSWGDMGNYYGAFPSALTLFDNMLELFFKTSSKVGDATQITATNPVIPNLVWHNYVLSDAVNSDNAYVYGAPFSNYTIVTGDLPLNKTNFVVKAAIQNPEMVFAWEMKNALEKRGIKIAGKALSRNSEANQTPSNLALLQNEKWELLFVNYGESLSRFAELINFKSINLFAEHLPCWIALEKTGVGYHKEGMKILNDFWSSKIDFSGARITDGSGLSRNNAISAQHFVDMLKYMHIRTNEAFLNSLPVAGVSGTLKNLCSGQTAHGKVQAKSGTMSKIKSYAGYVNSKTGKKIAFAFIVNNHNNSSSALVKQMEPVLNAMAAL